MCVERSAWHTVNAQHVAAALLAFDSSPLIQLHPTARVLSPAVLLWNPIPPGLYQGMETLAPH